MAGTESGSRPEAIPIPPGGSAPRVIGPPRVGGAARSTIVAAVSTVVVFALIVLVVINAPGWPAVKESFFNGEVFWSSLPAIVRAFWVNIQLFVVSEVLILSFGLIIAVLRSLPGPVFTPVRFLATVYVDI